MPTSMVPQQQYNMKIDGVEKNILHCMNQERKSNKHISCDVVLLASGVKHYAHKIVLISFSVFFREYFEDQAEEVSLSVKDSATDSEKDSENSKSDDDIVSIKSDETCESCENVKQRATCQGNIRTTVNLPGINTEELGPILDYMYMSQLVLRAANVNEILLVGCLLQISSVIEFCAEVLLKQPSWRSPLVSSKMLNFVKGRGTDAKREDAMTSSTTTATWVTNGERPTSHDMRFSRKRERIVKSDTTNDVGNMLAGPSRQFCSSGETTRGARKRRHPNFSTINGNDQKRDDVKGRRMNFRGRGRGNSRKCSSTIEEQQQEYLANIDFAELDRELTRSAQLMNSWKCHSSGPDFQQCSPNISTTCSQPTIPPPLVDVRSVNVISEGSDSRKCVDNNGLSYSAFGPVKVPQYLESRSLSSKYNLKNSETSIRKFSGENQAVTMFPQMSDCNRSLAAFGFPMFHPGYFGFPFINGTMGYSPNFPTTPFPGTPREKPVDGRIFKQSYTLGQRQSYDEKIAQQNRYAASIAAVYTNPATLQEYESSQFATPQPTNRQTTTYAATQPHIFPEHLTLRTKLGLESSARKGVRPYAEVPSCIPSHAGFKRFSSDIVQRKNSLSYAGVKEDENIRQDPTDLSMPFRARSHDSRNRGVSRHQIPRGDLVVANSKASSFVLNTRVERKQEIDGTSAIVELPTDLTNNGKNHHATHVYYHTRKRKLLRAAQDFSTNEKCKEDEKFVSNRPTHLTSTEYRHQSREIKCSSEDDIIAHECHNMEPSDLDSDDSGRPSSA